MIHKYPHSVKEAAKILDLEHQGWFNLIDLNGFNPTYQESCILGQLYSKYDEGMIQLFDLVMTDDSEEYDDTIFGTKCNKQEWLDEIAIRRGEIDWILALKLIAAGEIVQCQNGVEYSRSGNNIQVFTPSHSRYTIDNLFALQQEKFKLVAKHKFRHLNPGDFFLYQGQRFIKIIAIYNKINAIEISNGKSHIFDNTVEVE